MSTPNPIKIPSITQVQLSDYRAAIGGDIDGLMYITSDGVNAGELCRDIAGVETPLSAGGSPIDLITFTDITADTTVTTGQLSSASIKGWRLTGTNDRTITLPTPRTSRTVRCSVITN